MSKRRKRDFDLTDELPTAVDYLVGGVAPLLIMVMVGSLVWFLQDLVYVGAQSVRLRWTMFWFVIGMVGIARIAMERTPAYAGLYALGLGGAVAVMMREFFVMPPVGWFLLGVVWWCTHRLVWDCTLVDDTKDASGEGLLEIAGLDETAGGRERIEPAGRAAGPPWWRCWFIHDTSARAKPHPHGLWVIWFSLAALPMFGFGQAALARMGRDNGGLVLIALYLTAAVGLLLTTSFLGLRRYLRQRRLKMPGAMAAGWLATGSVIVGLVLLGSLLVPRPLSLAAGDAATNSLAGRERAESNTRTDERGEKVGDGEESSDAKEQGDGVKDGNTGEGGQEQGGEGEGGQDESGNGGSGPLQDRKAGSQSSAGSSAGASPPWLRWLGWLIVFAVVLYVLFRYWREIVAAVRDLWASLCAMFRPRERRRRAIITPTPALREPQVRFVELVSPFASGSPNPDTAVREMFAALEVWAAERGAGRPADATPMEFAGRLVIAFPGLASGVRQLAVLYSGLAYAERPVRSEELPALRRLWERMVAGG